MQFALERTSGPAFEPVTLAEMKLHLRTYASDTSEDALISSLITAAREWAENFTGRALVDQTWRLTLRRHHIVTGDIVGGFRIGPGVPFVPGFYYGNFFWHLDARQILLRKAPVLAITSVVSLAQDGTEATVDASTYQLREPMSKWPMLAALNNATWPCSDMRITFRAGFADTTGSPQTGAEVVPERYKSAIKLYAQAIYDRDPANIKLLMDTAAAVIQPERTELSLA